MANKNAHEEIDNAIFLNSFKNLGNKMQGVSRGTLPALSRYTYHSSHFPTKMQSIPQRGISGTHPLAALLMTLIQGTTKSEEQDKTPFQKMGGTIAEWLVPTGEGTVPEVDLYSLLDSKVTAEDEALYQKDLEQRKGMDFRNLLNMIGGVPKGVR